MGGGYYKIFLNAPNLRQDAQVRVYPYAPTNVRVRAYIRVLRICAYIYNIL